MGRTWQKKLGVCMGQVGSGWVWCWPIARAAYFGFEKMTSRFWSVTLTTHWVLGRSGCGWIRSDLVRWIVFHFPSHPQFCRWNFRLLGRSYREVDRPTAVSVSSCVACHRAHTNTYYRIYMRERSSPWWQRASMCRAEICLTNMLVGWSVTRFNRFVHL